MYTIEFHDDGKGTSNVQTCFASVFSLRDVRRVDEYLRHPHILQAMWRRAYILSGDNVVAVVVREPANAPVESLRYLARAPQYYGRQLPFVFSREATMAVAHWPQQVRSEEAIQKWATRQFSAGVVTVIVIDEKGVQTAWEKGNPEPIAFRSKL